MSEPWDELATSALTAAVKAVRPQVPHSRWFLFGSITTGKRAIGDVDLLVVCKSSEDCTIIRNGLGSICGRFPIHLMLMTDEEEVEVNFIRSEKAVEIPVA